MKAKDIAKKYGIDKDQFGYFLTKESTKKAIKVTGLFSDTVDDNDVDAAVELFKKEKAAEAAEAAERATAQAAAAAKAAEEKRRKEEAIAAMLVTSGFNFDGYTITKYSSYISGDDARQIDRDRLFENRGQALTDTLVLLRTQALKELKEAAYDLGCNAVIGVDFDYLTFEPETINGTVHYYQPYVVCVTANGNAVIIEKN